MPSVLLKNEKTDTSYATVSAIATLALMRLCLSDILR